MTEILPETLPPLPEKPKAAPKNIPITNIIALRDKGLSHRQIAKIVDCSKTNITNRLKEYNNHKLGVERFKKDKADHLAIMQSRLLFSVTDEDIKKMPPAARFMSFGILYDKERLERDQSTQNIGISAHIHHFAAALRQQIESKKVDNNTD